jgi:hypothetical protein
MKAPQQVSRKLQAKSLMEVLQQDGRVYRKPPVGTELVLFRDLDDDLVDVLQRKVEVYEYLGSWPSGT